MSRVAGLIELKVDGNIYLAKGNFTYNIGKPRREAVVGADTTHGFKETPQVAFIEGEITDRSDISIEELVSITDATVTLRLGNGKTIVLRNAWYAAEGTFNTEEGNGQVRFEGKSGEEIR
jgi:hypothetical protein